MGDCSYASTGPERFVICIIKSDDDFRRAYLPVGRVVISFIPTLLTSSTRYSYTGTGTTACIHWAEPGRWHSLAFGFYSTALCSSFYRDQTTRLRRAYTFMQTHQEITPHSTIVPTFSRLSTRYKLDTLTRLSRRPILGKSGSGAAFR